VKIFEPTSLNDFIFNDEPSRIKLESITNGKLPFPIFGKNAICLHGMPGTGKTTLALLMPTLLEQTGNLLPSIRSVNLFDAPRYWNVSMCGYAKTSVSIIAELQDRVSSDVTFSPSGWHYEILDEVDVLTPAAQSSLKSAITFAKSTIFILTTNYLKKLEAGLIDRCILVEMNQAANAAYVPLGQRLLQKMQLTGSEITPLVIEQYAKAARGSIRDFGSAIAVDGLANGGVIQI
jgi:DNA polymerase III delta prime subunit